MLKRLILTILVRLYKGVFKIFRPDISIHWLSGHELTADRYSEVVNFRKARLQKKLPYLFSDEHEKWINEQEIDERSYHMVLKRNHEVVGYTRLVPVPFEYSLVSTEKKEFTDYLEITRAVVIPEIKGLGELLLISAGVHVCLNTDKKGFVAICRPELLQNFLNYGLTTVKHGITIDYRGTHQYTLIKGSFYEMAVKVLKEKILKINRKGFVWIRF